jgi:ectoine hydroxylase-related dioxygenase (phytanoyl-CoA dioxygenase family)
VTGEKYRQNMTDDVTRAALDPVALITDDVIEGYRRDGVVFLPQALHPEWLLLAEMGLNRVLGDSGQKKHKFFDDQPGEFLETVRNFEVTPEIQRLMYDSPIADMISVLVGSPEMWLYSDEFFIKGPGSRRTPWHQDLPYWPLAGEKIASMWISLDPLGADECLEYIPGSHRRTIYDGFNPRRVAEDPTLPFYGEELPPLPDIEASRGEWDIVSWPITPGDVVIAHPGVLHGGGPTSATTQRRTITVRCYGDDIVYARRPPSRPTVPRTPGLSLQLQPGDPLRHPWYPQLRPRPPWARVG